MDDFKDKDMNSSEEENDIITLYDEDGESLEFEFLDYVEYKGEEYIVLLPTESEDGGVIIFKVETSAEEPDKEEYLAVENDEVLYHVFDIFKEKFKDEFDFEN